MMLEYVAVSNPASGKTERGRIACCGIAVYQDRCLVEFIEDITPDHAEAERLASLLNRFEASLLHFRDIVEDYVASR